MSDDQDELLTEAEEAHFAKLPAEFVARIDEAILAIATPHFRKVAYIVGRVMLMFRDECRGIPDRYYATRIIKLIEAGRLEVAGNPRRMRFSEVRLPSPPSRSTQ